MLRPLAATALIVWASPSLAQDCPDFYRFVDFGVTDSSGALYRGGPLFRAESFDEVPILLADQTRCLAVRPTAIDGRGNPIPVVASVGFDPAATGANLSRLGLSISADAVARAETSAAAHQASLAAPDTQVIRGPDYLCAKGPNGTLSCQLVSPYPGNAALVVYCDSVECQMPALAITDQLTVTASWPVAPDAGRRPDATAADIRDTIGAIEAFLGPLSSALQ